MLKKPIALYINLLLILAALGAYGIVHHLYSLWGVAWLVVPLVFQAFYLYKGSIISSITAVGLLGFMTYYIGIIYIGDAQLQPRNDWMMVTAAFVALLVAGICILEAIERFHKPIAKPIATASAPARSMPPLIKNKFLGFGAAAALAAWPWAFTGNCQSNQFMLAMVSFGLAILLFISTTLTRRDKWWPVQYILIAAVLGLLVFWLWFVTSLNACPFTF